jgi:leucyl-tRNA synthetase
MFMRSYNHSEIEKKWQDFWEKNQTFASENISDKPKFYTLDMFPYPSGAGLHVGHPEGYTANDIVARYKHARGFNVLHPMGWDAFGLPAENYAIKTGVHPSITTAENIATFKRQIKSLGFSYDWNREIDTTDPKYYKWTQWIFLKLFEHGFAYEQDLPINYCPSCKTGLANEEVVQGRCERCDSLVEKKKIRQWVLAITKYADRLEKDVEKLDWPRGIKDMQINWIGRSEGCEFEMDVISSKTGLDSRPDLKTIYFASGNAGKLARLQKVFSRIDSNISIENVPEYVDVHETWSTPLENALQKLEPYRDLTPALSSDRRGSKYQFPIIANDIALHFEWIDFDPTHVKREALKYFWRTEADSTQEEVGKMMNDFYKKLALDNGGKLDFYYLDSWAILLPNGEIKTTEFKREYTLTGQEYGPLDIHLPMRNLFLSKLTGKPGSFVDDESFFGEFEPMRVALEGLLKSSLSKQNSLGKIRVYTTRIDTVFGMTYAVIAPDHPDTLKFIAPEQKAICEEYIAEVKNKADVERTAESKEKTWVFTGNYVVNPFNGEQVPLWIADYVLGNYGTGAVMAVPAHDERDFEFARKYKLAIRTAIVPTARSISWLRVRLKQNLSSEQFEELKTHNIIEPLIDNNQTTDFGIMSWDYIQSRRIEFILNYFDERNIQIQECKLFTDVHEYSELCYENTNGNWERWVWKNSFQLLKELTAFAEQKGFWNKKVNYKLRDWLFSRQRYWGEPIPLIHLDPTDFEKLPRVSDMSEPMEPNKAYIYDKKWTDKRCKNCTCVDIGCTKLIINGKSFSRVYNGIYTKIICDYNLPLELPQVERYEPAGDGQSPLATVESFVNVKLADNLTWKRETNTMPQWGGSCWYYLRFMDAHNPDELVNKEVEAYWGNVDSYVWGAEHAVLHLLYARFWHKFLFDIWVVSTDEPFFRLRNQGMILWLSYKDAKWKLIANDLVEERDGKYFSKETGEELSQMPAKMSKSLKNVINPDDVVGELGADTLRLYEMAMGDFKDTKPWDTKAIIWVRRFLEKVWRLYTDENPIVSEDDTKTEKILHKTIKKVGEDIEEYRFNTAISQMMICVNNGLPKDETLKNFWKENFLKLLHPFAPHMAEELWATLWQRESIFLSSWPAYDEKLTIDDTVKIWVQISGKVRGDIEVSLTESQDSVMEKVKNNPDIWKWIDGKEIVKIIYIAGKILNIVIK